MNGKIRLRLAFVIFFPFILIGMVCKPFCRMRANMLDDSFHKRRWIGHIDKFTWTNLYKEFWK